ncbi:MAG TPA: hypothetical protein DF296_14725 [Candidatus Margulisbacteria bacterium]|nr:MAG: hypothetical protein A2X43_09505 [Candidatus Margulisbacteria bacterium GWD2_39_127]OGI02875.1 MAG: hypothetical protein A2X42_02260 [Candidatus Margulisbacteria bacterium GWF2_38_17]OGI09656.1 MAG: hypothetical protein A2X41_04970 [Candidatus Margulisbacteria bacterium GWE2_39_32]HAR62178.1 hypothetical protein [Candidatus Margulisiibacteriota bacterium]HCT86443.1 hypothetical protein [Candidatus Margulisiibacteriota bacterium]
MINNLTFEQQKVQYSFSRGEATSGNKFSSYSKETLYAESTLLTINDDKVEIVHRTLEIEINKSFKTSLPELSDRLNSSKIPGYSNSSLVPDYWNAENTSSRIADLATSLAGMWKTQNPDKDQNEFQEFLNKLKSSIEEGFSQALHILSNTISSPVRDLINDTYALTMDKVDKSFADLIQDYDKKVA